MTMGGGGNGATGRDENGRRHRDGGGGGFGGGGTPRERWRVILEAASDVGPQLFFSLLIITVSFLPVFVLGGESGRLFKPLAYTKTYAMASAAVLSVTVIPVLMIYFITPRLISAWRGSSLRFLVAIVVSALAAL